MSKNTMDERERLRVLSSYRIIDSSSEGIYSDYVDLASVISDCPVVLLTFVDDKRHWVKASVKFDLPEISRDQSICEHVFQSRREIYLPDTLLDEKMKHNYFVANSPHVRFYYGLPVTNSQGFVLGTLCVIDFQPKTLNDRQKKSLRTLTKKIMSDLDYRRMSLPQNNFLDNLSIMEKLMNMNIIFSNMSEGVVLQDPNGEIIQCNAAAQRILGLNQDQLVGSNSHDSHWRTLREDESVYPGAEHPNIRAAETGKTVSDVLGVESGTGEYKWISVTSIPLFEAAGGKPTMVLSNFSDITENRVLYKKLLESDRINRAVLQSAPFAMIAVDPHGRIIQFNQEASRILGYTADEMLQKTTPESFHDPLEMAQRSRELMEEEGVSLPAGFEVFVHKAKQGIIESREWTYITKSGQRVPVRLTVLPMRDGDGDAHGFLGVVEDLTSRKILQQELDQTTQAAHHASKMAILGEMVAGIAHEINNPLAIIASKSQLLTTRMEAGLYNEKVFSEELQKINKTSQRVAKIIRGLKMLSSGAKGGDTKRIPLWSLLFDTIEMSSMRFKDMQIQLVVEEFQDVMIDCHPE